MFEFVTLLIINIVNNGDLLRMPLITLHGMTNGFCKDFRRVIEELYKYSIFRDFPYLQIRRNSLNLTKGRFTDESSIDTFVTGYNPLHSENGTGPNCNP